ncbi:Hint domain-containing protein [Roseovarius sp. C7]|uniref:Hint domain-containing protein n=1 Tax=Roseovarius sp. C7 TaxID=3398643 RepID=UPI0039F6C548
MAVLDNAIWLTGASGEAEDGTTTITEGANSTTVTGTFTGTWDASQSGFAVSEFGAYGVSTPITANYAFSTPVENLSFALQNVNSAGSTNDDMFTIYAYDETGTLLPSADVVAGLSGLDEDTVTVNPDGSVSVEGDGAGINDVTVTLPGAISQLTIVFGPGPDAPQTGGAGIGDLSFTVPASAPCFTLGTWVETGRGAQRIEDLRVGDRIATRDHGRQPLRWIGFRRVAAEGAQAPIVFARGALGNDRELRVSPQHRMLLSGWRAELLFGEREVLCAAKALVNGETIYRDAGGEVTYVHLLFDRHELVKANGAWSESFHPGAWMLGAMDAAARAEILGLFPELQGGPAPPMISARRSLRSYEARLVV